MLVRIGSWQGLGFSRAGTHSALSQEKWYMVPCELYPTLLGKAARLQAQGHHIKARQDLLYPQEDKAG